MKTDSKVDYTSEEFWKDAPEGATHYANFKVGVDCFYMSVSGCYAKSFKKGVWMGTSWSSVEVEENSNDRVNFIPRPQPKPVYTQEKSALMEGSLKRIIDLLVEYGVSSDGIYHDSTIDNLKEPQQKAKWVAMSALGMLNIDTRTDEDKAFDRFLDSNYNMKRSDFSQSQDDKDFMEGVYLAFKAGVTWSKSNE